MSTFEFQNKICNLPLDWVDGFNLALFKKIWGQNAGRVKQDRIFFDKVRATSWKLRTIALSYPMLMFIKYPNFVCKCLK